MGLLPDITMLLDDPDIGGNQPFTIIRTSVPRKRGRADVENRTIEKIPATGSVQPVGENVLEQLPEGDRERADYIIRTKTPLQNGSSSGSVDLLPDEIEYLDERYKLIKTKEWHQWGMFVAIVTRSKPPAASENVSA